jgi:hypothetical protein
MKKSALLLFGIAILLLSPILGCSLLGPSSPPQPTLVTYINDQFGYSIGYPKNWQASEQSKKEVYLLSSAPDKAYIGIGVLENATLPISEIAMRWVLAVSQKEDNVVLTNRMQMQGLWDWYVSYDYVTAWGEDFHAEAFFKQVGTRIYRVETVGEKAKYSEYPFAAMLSSFKLSPEQSTQ